MVVLVLVVLDWVARLCNVQLPTARGAALACPQSPHDFRLNANTAEMREKKRLPLTTQCVAFTRGLRFAYTRTVELHGAG